MRKIILTVSIIFGIILSFSVPVYAQSLDEYTPTYLDKGYMTGDGKYSEGNTMDMDGNYLNLSEICPEYENIITEEDMKTTQAPILWLYGKDGWNPGGYPEAENVR